ncbi:hypothetical protein NC653_040257 [Populus alba x Populus x berolinensis]|uniref:Uncharacterized protein n=1 Tax=Populus alba x Populus x berolinensis TaxID=444605 RepID=A0AAD6LD89_9ROSI|nr:hypothetical protein NC653_040257 [Populus alba x Populus x berolinensis]
MQGLAMFIASVNTSSFTLDILGENKGKRVPESKSILTLSRHRRKSCRGTSRAFAVVDDLFDFDSRYMLIGCLLEMEKRYT